MWSYQVCAIICLIFGIYAFITNMFSEGLFSIKNIILKNLPLVKDKDTYNAWISPVSLIFKCYFFNVTNPDEVMQGANPNLVEYGPFTYREVYEKQIVDVDEEFDEIIYDIKSTFTFDKYASVNISKRDTVTILNPAYIGTISMLTTLPPNYMDKFGNNIPKLFPNRNSIFLKANPKEILFDGVKLTCNEKKFPELSTICKTLKALRSPVLKEGEKDGVYYLSIFQRVNGTIRGRFSVNRGINNISELGNIASYNGKKVQTIWKTEKCNIVRGSDTITWPPLINPMPSVLTFIPDLCRSVEVDYDKKVSIYGLTGFRFAMKERTWFLNTSQCYCLEKNKVPNCLPQGLIDVSNCLKVPIIISEPHFLHGDPQLLMYAHGLNPDKDLHETFVVIEPYTGTPLSGQKKIQLNLKLERQPVNLLSNISEGYFPLLWCSNVRIFSKIIIFQH
ncbi:sensory neuron membrane protein 2-like isoform X2 [Apis dorsata]|uniref:sensory neuron membrane protein 2-like isoform X2 n=1 Tax=Apis dorsata TaxID=7462 RepID=UPI0012937166|nr:sensory neuron membrane protein 2-like isoform X2 [Apis dorsata]